MTKRAEYIVATVAVVIPLWSLIAQKLLEQYRVRKGTKVIQAMVEDFDAQIRAEVKRIQYQKDLDLLLFL